TFDLAFYVQALWLALRGEWHVSLLNVPLLGNHAEPIVFLATPLFALWPHPMWLVALQSIALATLPLTGWRIALHLGFSPRAAALLALATVLSPATGFVALHEFHPEALAAPFILLLIEARLKKQRGLFWLWFLTILACKENLALLLITFCLVHALLEWRRKESIGFQFRWNVLPLLAATACFVGYTRYLGPSLNAGNVDYLELYSHLGHSGTEIITGFFLHPQKALGALGKALAGGNLLWALLLPMLGLPFLRPHWLLIALPILLQHLLSWRVSEWSIRVHYAAPMIPLFWIASVEALRQTRLREVAAISILAACVLSQWLFGPAGDLVSEIKTAPLKSWERHWKKELLAQIPPETSVTAPLPYLSHLATRKELLSLHHVLKGLKTLSRAEFRPGPPGEVVLIDYADAITFDPRSGYYHPAMRTVDGRIIPSSDALLHAYLSSASWNRRTCNSMVLYRRAVQEDPAPPAPLVSPVFRIDEATELAEIKIRRGGTNRTFDFRLSWTRNGTPSQWPWCMLLVSGKSGAGFVIKGACVPELAAGRVDEEWSITLPPDIAPGLYEFSLLFYHHEN
ncbi:MAG: DUF2079 domain-containing protein, partial [Verrucomicrobiota bacterium]